MKVQTCGDRITDIGKNLRHYDAIDTGLFRLSRGNLRLSRAGEVRQTAGANCSLADAVQLMAGDNNVRAIDIGDAWWQDVDTPQMLKYAERQMSDACRARPLKRAHQWPTRQHAIMIVAPCDDFAPSGAGPNQSRRAENQAHAGDSHPKMKIHWATPSNASI